MAREKVTLAYSGALDTSVLFEFTNALHQGVYPLNATLSRAMIVKQPHPVARTTER